MGNDDDDEFRNLASVLFEEQRRLEQKLKKVKLAIAAVHACNGAADEIIERVIQVVPGYMKCMFKKHID